MMRKLLVVLCLAVATFAGDKLPVTDASIEDQVKIRLAGDMEVKGGALEVAVKDGVVTLKGRVESDHVKGKAEKLAKKIKGVKSVVNSIQVEKAERRVP